MNIATPNPTHLHWMLLSRWERIWYFGLVILTVVIVAAGIYSFLAASGHVPATPWSPIGELERELRQPVMPVAPPENGSVNV